jgi:hypothetical protein
MHGHMNVTMHGHMNVTMHGYMNVKITQAICNSTRLLMLYGFYG